MSRPLTKPVMQLPGNRLATARSCARWLVALVEWVEHGTKHRTACDVAPLVSVTINDSSLPEVAFGIEMQHFSGTRQHRGRAAGCCRCGH